jgi:hypothetical protein
MTDPSPRIACTLTSDDLAIQAGAWRRLRDASQLGLDETGDGIRLRFRTDPGVEDELRRLVAIENVCCSWAAWSVQADADQAAVLVISSSGEGVEAARALFR